MANSYSGFFATLPAAMASASAAKVANNFLLDAVYRDFRPTVAMEFDTVNVSVPNSSATVTNVAGGALTLSDVTSTPKGIQLNQHPALYFAVPDYDQARSPQGLRDAFLDEAIKKITNYVDAQIAALVTTTNFATYSAVATGADDNIPDSAMSAAWKALAGNDVNVRDVGNLFLAVHSDVYGNLLTNASWTQQSNIGEISSGIRQSARLGQQWGALVDFDRQLPVTSGAYTSLLFHRNAIGLVARPMASPTNGGIQAMTVYYRGLPIRVTLDWNQSRLAETVTVDCLFGAAVVRPDHGIVLTTS